MPARLLLLSVFVVMSAVPAVGGNRRARVLCKQTCAESIAACTEETGRRRRCKRQTVRRCLRQGISVCVPPAETVCVATTGSDAAECGVPDAPCRTIQFAIDQRIAPYGAGVIKVGAGTFSGVSSCPPGDEVSDPAVVCVANKQITLLGGFVAPNWDAPTGDPEATVIDAQTMGRAMHVFRGGEVGPTASLVVEGITIRNGLADGTVSDPLGGGLYAEHSPIVLRNVIFRDNEARGASTSEADGGRAAGGGLAAYSGWSSVAAPALLENVRFEGNRARGGAGTEVGGYALGGAVFTHSIALLGADVVLSGNTATGGTTDGFGTNGVDKADALGGAVAVGLHGLVELRGVHAWDNVARGGAAPNGEAGGAFGGAMYVEKGTLSVADSQLDGNLAWGGDGRNVTSGGSIAQGGAIQALNARLTVDRVLIVSNEARAGDGSVRGGVPQGGGIAMILGAFEGDVLPFLIRNSVVARNGITHGAGSLGIGGGGGIFLNGVTGTVEHATIADNRLGDPNDVGAGVGALPVPGWQTHIDVIDSIVANHHDLGLHPSAYANAGIWVAENASAALLRVLFANNLHDSNAGVDDPYNLPPGAFVASGVMTAADAGFMAPEDYHLVSGSPAVDLAVGSSATVDLDGNARPAGAVADLGAYELVP